jgi:predicted Fe-S protein YdhL (DUF1289 family)
MTTSRTDTDRDALAEGWYLRGIIDHYCAVCGRDVDECQDWQTYSQTKHETLRGTDWLAAHDAEVRRQALAPITVVRMKRSCPNYDEGQIGLLRETGKLTQWVEFGKPRQFSHGESYSTGCWCGSGEYDVVLRAAVDATDPTAHDRAVAARAWSEGYRLGLDDAGNDVARRNPYRADTIEAGQ